MRRKMDLLLETGERVVEVIVVVELRIYEETKRERERKKKRDLVVAGERSQCLDVFAERRCEQGRRVGTRLLEERKEEEREERRDERENKRKRGSKRRRERGKKRREKKRGEKKERRDGERRIEKITTKPAQSNTQPPSTHLHPPTPKRRARERRNNVTEERERERERGVDQEVGCDVSGEGLCCHCCAREVLRCCPQTVVHLERE